MKRTLPLALAAFFLAFPASAQDRRQPDQKPADCAAAQGKLPKTWEGRAFALDGNTISGVGLRPRIRLWGIQAAELHDKQTGQETVAGMRARAALEDLLDAGDHRASCRVLKWDRSCALVAQCTINAEMPTGTKAAPHDLGLRLIEDGLAYGFSLDDALPWDDAASERYAHYEVIARRAHKGLWPSWLREPESMNGPK
jgi:endonuclease YncB( thermonuclease family)